MVGVYAQLDMGSISGFNFPFDIGVDGPVIPSGFTLSGTANEIHSSTSINTGQNALLFIDGIFNSDGAAVSIASETKLFDFVIDSGAAGIST